MGKSGMGKGGMRFIVGSDGQGHMAFSSDGMTFMDGKSYAHVGNMAIGSDGSTHVRIGNAITSSRGKTHLAFGDNPTFLV